MTFERKLRAISFFQKKKGVLRSQTAGLGYLGKFGPVGDFVQMGAKSIYFSVLMDWSISLGIRKREIKLSWDKITGEKPSKHREYKRGAEISFKKKNKKIKFPVENFLQNPARVPGKFCPVPYQIRVELKYLPFALIPPSVISDVIVVM